ncbi:MAG TPA: hypothetical protein VKY74_24970 [Chloroflexia bacterium]|nr:hypothetical protein [Chloroflexia bacterium]
MAGLGLLAGCSGAETTAAPATPTAVGSNFLPTVPPPATAAPSATPVPVPTVRPTAPPVPTMPPTVPPTPTVAPVATGVAEEQAEVIYSLIAHDLVTQSLVTTTTKTIPAYIGISPRAGQGSLLDTDASNLPIPENLIEDLADLGTTVAFVPFMEAIGPLEEGGQVRDGGVYLTLGVLTPQSDADHVAAYASYYRATNDATGYLYHLEKGGSGPWVIKDRQQVWDH